MEESQNRLRTFFVGDDLDLTKRWGAIAGSLFVVTFAIYAFGYYQTVYALIPNRVILYGAAGILVLLSAWQAYQNRSLVASLLLCIAPVTALFFTIIGEAKSTIRRSLKHSYSAPDGDWCLAFHLVFLASFLDTQVGHRPAASPVTQNKETVLHAVRPLCSGESFNSGVARTERMRIAVARETKSEPQTTPGGGRGVRRGHRPRRGCRAR